MSKNNNGALYEGEKKIISSGIFQSRNSIKNKQRNRRVEAF